MDIRDARIDSLLQEIITTNLCEVPGDEPWTVEHFEKRTAVSYIDNFKRFRRVTSLTTSFNTTLLATRSFFYVLIHQVDQSQTTPKMIWTKSSKF